MSRQILGFRTLSLVIVAAGFTSGCETIYSDMYSPERSRFVAPVERTTVTQLPPETESSTVVLPPSAPVEMAPAPVVMPDAGAAIPGMETAPALPGADAAPVDPNMGAAPMDPAMGGAAMDPAMGGAPAPEAAQ